MQATRQRKAAQPERLRLQPLNLLRKHTNQEQMLSVVSYMVKSSNESEQVARTAIEYEWLQVTKDSRNVGVYHGTTESQGRLDGFKTFVVLDCDLFQWSAAQASPGCSCILDVWRCNRRSRPSWLLLATAAALVDRQARSGLAPHSLELLATQITAKDNQKWP